MWQVFIYLNTSPRITCRLLIPSCLQHEMMKFCCICAISTAVTSRAPLDTNSKPIPPVPANQSSISTSSKSIRFARRLNKLSFAKSVVGRALKLRGTSKCRPLYLPLIIRIVLVLEGQMEFPQSCSAGSR